MKIISHVILAIAFPERMPERFVKRWAEGMKASTEEIAQRLKDSIKDIEEYQHKLAGAAQLGYSQYVSKEYISKGGLSGDKIVTRYTANIKDAYEKYRAGVDEAFEPVEGEVGKRFKEKVERARDHYARGSGKKVYAFAGSKATELGCAPLAAAWLVGEQKIVGRLRAADSIKEGGPFLVTHPEAAPSLRTSLNQRLIQAGITIVNAGLMPEVIKSENDRTNGLVQGFVDKKLKLADFETGGDSKVDYFVDENGQLYLEVKVSEK